LRRGRPLEESTLGLYRFDDGRPLGVWSGQGPRIASLYDEGEIRGLYRTRPNGYAIGSGLQTRNPTVGTASFTANAAAWRSERATRVALHQEEVFVRSERALLGCTLSIPPGPGRHPGMVFAHGSGPAPRSYNSINALYFNHLGIATLSCDKRGIGQSGGTYPGEFPSAPAVDQYARDVQAQARFLSAQREIDAGRVGVAGVSQAGWIMPLAVVREPALRFMIGFVSPTLTQGETDLWATLNDQGQSPPTRTDEDMEAEVRRSGPSGVDPMPSIRALRVPALWLFGGKDRTVPSRLCVERLDPVTREPGRDLTYRIFPGGTHGLVLTPNGLLAEQARSGRMVDGLYQTIRDWLAARGLTG
jgi:pimeloyl-ACP methyl ester carboxylesterase